MNHTIVQLWTRTFWQFQVLTGFLWSRTLGFICYPVLSDPKTLRHTHLQSDKKRFLIHFEDKFTFDLQLSETTIMINTITWFGEKSQFNIKTDLVFAEMLEYLAV